MPDDVKLVRVTPVGDAVVRDEVTHQPLKPGARVALTRYIQRRIADGSLRADDGDGPVPPPEHEEH